MWHHKVHMLAVLLVVVGALNLGAMGAFKVNLLKTLLGNKTIHRTVYVLIGLSAVYLVWHHHHHRHSY